MLSVDKVTRTFESGTQAFSDITFKASEGEIIGILGTSGCGKSSLLRVIAGLDPASSGAIQIDQEDIDGVHEKVGVIFQEPRLLPWLNVLDNVTFGLHGNSQTQVSQATEILQLVGLKGFEKHYPKELSGGMAQRVAIARALVTTPDLLLLDEPFSALDAFTKMQLQDLLLQIWQSVNSTMLLVTHDIDEALYLCDRLLIFNGQPGALIRDVQVSGPRPRQRGDQALAQQKEQILGWLDLERTLV
ncbi:ATP-binding cassette domain-containing protein [Caldalkalibacillus salinus]|uniref:ATP-binding cassette domain-containing protein n=1 Tax=Caldalkalibacillus salinus TaxID=2803787 RepID=UPI0019214209